MEKVKGCPLNQNLLNSAKLNFTVLKQARQAQTKGLEQTNQDLRKQREN